MPAIMIRPAVGSSEKVSGRIRATPATGPRPGSTPIAVPANAPTKAASKLAGVAAMLSPYSRPWREFIFHRHSGTRDFAWTGIELSEFRSHRAIPE